MNTEVFQTVLSYIDKHIYEKVSLADLASLVGYSPFYFSKKFAERMGISVTGYIRIRKLQHSVCSLLEGKKVLDVSLMYSFESHEGFTRSFTSLFGSTPSTVKKSLTVYQVPKYIIPSMKVSEKEMKTDKNNTLLDDMHQLVFEVIRASFEEVEAGYCTKIAIALEPNNTIKISDNGRGIPLSEKEEVSKDILEKIFGGHPISNLEYTSIEELSPLNMQIVNSLCEQLQLNVYRDNKRFQQDYVRGIAQHKINCEEYSHASGMEIIFKPDSQIFGDRKFSMDIIEKWVANFRNKVHIEISKK